MRVLKKDNTVESFDPGKIERAITTSSKRVMHDITTSEKDLVVELVKEAIKESGAVDPIPVTDIHKYVEMSLEKVLPEVAQSYRSYRNFKQGFVHDLDKVYMKSLHIRHIGDKENSNTNSALAATKRCLIFNDLNKRLYRRFFMTPEELTACKVGYIYVHDQSARLDTMNCCLCDVKTIMSGGFEMGNIWYEEPKTLDVAFDVLGDIILATASQQYGGFTVPEVDKIMAPYAQKSYDKHYEEISQLLFKDAVNTLSVAGLNIDDLPKTTRYKIWDRVEASSREEAMRQVRREYRQGYQGIEMKLNTVGSSRGDYPFVTFTFGIGTSKFEKMCSETILKVHMKGQGKKGFEKPVLFPKLVFLYDKDLHENGKELNDLFELGIKCSSKTMYPDWLSLTGEGYVPEMYKKYKAVISPMGKCKLAHVKPCEPCLKGVVA